MVAASGVYREWTGSGRLALPESSAYRTHTGEEIYQAGQTASLLLQTPISGHALVTVERERVLRSFIVKVEGNAPVIQVPLLDSDAPNVFVSALLLRGSASSPKKYKQPEFRLGYCQLTVEKPGNKLFVELQPGTNSYLPGDYVQISGWSMTRPAKAWPTRR